MKNYRMKFSFCDCVEALRPSQQFQSGRYDFLSSWVEPVLSKGYSALLKASSESLTHDPSTPTLTLYQLSHHAPENKTKKNILVEYSTYQPSKTAIPITKLLQVNRKCCLVSTLVNYMYSQSHRRYEILISSWSTLFAILHLFLPRIPGINKVPIKIFGTS